MSYISYLVAYYLLAIYIYVGDIDSLTHFRGHHIRMRSAEQILCCHSFIIRVNSDLLLPNIKGRTSSHT